MARTLFVTPDFTSEVTQCRTLTTPANAEWLGVFNKALLTMLEPYNWEQINETDLTVDETIALVTTILNDFWDTQVCCDGDICLMPNGGRVLRLGDGYQIEEMANGGWREPTGDYTVPPTPARTETTEQERKCLASANAANVLYEVYEIVTDGLAAELSNEAIIAAIVAYILSTIGAWLALAFVSFLGLLAALFGAFIAIARYMTIDLWDEHFSEILLCLLYDCATDTAGVVTFDLTCFDENHASTVDLFGSSAENDLRLYGQIWFILQTIGADGLNAAGATTAITAADCSACAPTHVALELYPGYETGATLTETDYNVYRITSTAGSGMHYIRRDTYNGTNPSDPDVAWQVTAFNWIVNPGAEYHDGKDCNNTVQINIAITDQCWLYFGIDTNGTTGLAYTFDITVVANEDL